MNLRVDLILPSERRSASLINPKIMLRAVTVVVPLILAVCIVMLVFNMITLGNQLSMAEADWAEMEPRQKEALSLRGTLARNVQILSEIEGWSASHIDWHRQLLALQEAMPAELQLTSLRVEHAFRGADQNVPGRLFALTLDGRGAETTAERDVERLRSRLRGSGPFEPIEDATVDAFGADPKSRSDRVFRIKCRYQPRTFS
jgi:hypothetical protein